MPTWGKLIEPSKTRRADAMGSMKINRPLLGTLTQGSIFTCACAEGYTDRAVYGFVITARCDVEQDKFPILNYLPTVTLNDWIHRDGFNILHSRLSAELSGNILNTLLQSKISTSILDSQSLRDIEILFFKPPFFSPEAKSQAARFSALIDRHELLAQILDEYPKSAHNLYAINEKQSSSLLKELVQQKITGFYFLPSVYDSNDDVGYVINLREVRHISRMAAQKIADGLDASEGRAFCAENGLSFEVEDFAMPIGELSSPAVEHVLQTFSNLFGRIGLDDPPKSYVEQICARRPKFEEFP